MKKLVLLPSLFVFAWSNENSTPTMQSEEADKELCGDEPWECIGLKYFIPNSNLEQAYQLYFKSSIQTQKKFSEERGQKVEQNVAFLNIQHQ